jgi:hypothetical protein
LEVEDDLLLADADGFFQVSNGLVVVGGVALTSRNTKTAETRII